MPGQIKRQSNPKTSIESLGSIGDLEVRLAADDCEISQAIAIRQQIFNADQSVQMDGFDPLCEHLIVVDRSLKPDKMTGKIVATYRLMGSQMATNGFCSANEFNLDGLLERHRDKRFLEFGRSCVLPNYRGKRTLELLWHGSWAYVRKYDYQVMFGCASFDGTNPEIHREALSFLIHHYSASKDWRVDALKGRAAQFDLIDKSQIDMRRAVRSLPPLIKGYLRLGAMFSNEFVIDDAFDTLDALVLLPISHLNKRYVKHYGENAERLANA